jgi:hypothetical protein
VGQPSRRCLRRPPPTPIHPPILPVCSSCCRLCLPRLPPRCRLCCHPSAVSLGCTRSAPCTEPAAIGFFSPQRTWLDAGCSAECLPLAPLSTGNVNSFANAVSSANQVGGETAVARAFADTIGQVGYGCGWVEGAALLSRLHVGVAPAHCHLPHTPSCKRLCGARPAVVASKAAPRLRGRAAPAARPPSPRRATAPPC